MLRAPWCLVVVIALAIPAAAPSRARGQGAAVVAAPADELASIRELALRANYRAALPAARRFLERSDLPPAIRNQALELLATIHLAMRAEADARAVLAQLYARDPAHRLSDPDASPVVQTAFARAREAAAPVAVTITHDAPVLERRVAPELTARVVEHADVVQEIRLVYRARGGRTTTLVMPLDADGIASARIPLEGGEEGYAIEYWLEALAPSGHALATLGGSDAPLVIEVPAALAAVAVTTGGPEVDRGAASGGDVTGEWWFWTLVGVVVVGAGVGVGVGVAVAPAGPSDGSLGNVTLPLLAF